MADVERQLAPTPSSRTSRTDTLKGSVDGFEMEMIRRVLFEEEGNKTKAAARLKISRRTLYNKLAEYGLL